MLKSLRLLAAVLACSLGAAGIAGPSYAAAEHKPGRPGDGRALPADLKVPAGSPGALPGTTPDAQGKVPHVCAGKKILYHSHVDAAYATRLNGKLSVTVVDGSEVVRDPSKVCMRLGPDAYRSGREVSRFVVPSQRQYRFLGKPGDIVWHAPAEDVDNEQKPIWAGIGAFDPEHELKVPTGVVGNKVKLSWTKVVGPGQAELWSGMPSSLRPKVDRLLSSVNRDLQAVIDVGAHAHLNWTFSKAGVYHFFTQASMVDGRTMKEEKSAPQDLVWLVGTDEEVGLPTNTTPSKSRITKTAEQVRDEQFSDKPGQPTPPDQPTPPPGGQQPPKHPVGTEEAATEQLKKWLYGNLKHAPNIVFEKGQHWLRGWMRDGNYEVDLVQGPQEKISRSNLTVIEVPDSMLQTLDKEHSGLSDFPQAWVLPAQGNVPRFGIDSTALVQEGLVSAPYVTLGDAKTPEDGRYVTMDTEGKVRLDSERFSNADVVPMGQQHLRSHLFTHPGFYLNDYEMYVQYPEGVTKPTYGSAAMYYAVGNHAINALRKINYENAVARAKAEGKDPKTVPLPTYLPTDEDEPSPAPDPKPDPQPEPDPAPVMPRLTPQQALAQVKERWRQQIPQWLITRGHMDQKIVQSRKPGNQGGYQVFLHDTLNPAKPKNHYSGQFALAVPDAAWGFVESTQSGWLEVQKAAPHGVWVLPQSQDQNLPWLGFNTNGVKYGALKDPGIEVRWKNFSGPGRMMLGFDNVEKGFEKHLDSADPQSVLRFPTGAHAHTNVLFTAPGTYTLDVVFSVHRKDGKVIELPLRTSYVVGNSSIYQAKKLMPAPPKEKPEPGTDDDDRGSHHPGGTHTGAHHPGGGNGASAGYGNGSGSSSGLWDALPGVDNNGIFGGGVLGSGGLLDGGGLPGDGDPQADGLAVDGADQGSGLAQIPMTQPGAAGGSQDSGLTASHVQSDQNLSPTGAAAFFGQPWVQGFLIGFGIAALVGVILWSVLTRPKNPSPAHSNPKSAVSR